MKKSESGFTVVEVLVALFIMTVALLGVLAMFKGAMSASGYSRRATEAAVLAEDKLEQLRTVPITTVTDGSDTVDSFDRTWTLATVGTLTTITVAVTWTENDGNHGITFRTVRNLD